MKFSKPKGELKTKTAVDKGKFKSKEGISNGHVQKGTKLAAKLVKKGSFNNQLGDLVEVNAKSKIGIKEANGRQKKKKSGSKSLSPEVKLGLELDAMLEKKASNNEKTSNEPTSGSPLPKRKRKGKQATALNKPDLPTTDDKPNQSLAKSDSPHKKNKAKKLKKKIESENHSSPVKKQEGAKGSQIDSNLITPPNPQNAKAAGKKRKRKLESENDSSPVKKLDVPKGTPTDSDGVTPPKPRNARANKKNKKKIESENHSSPVKKPDGAKGSSIDSDGATLTKPQNDEAKGKKKISKGKKENLIATSMDSQDYSLDPKEIEVAAKSLLQVFNEKKSASKQLLQATDEPIYIYFLFYEILQNSKVIRFKLAHSLVSDDSDICLLGKDFASTIDKSKTLWNEFLSKEDCSSLITEVIPLKSLLKDYMQHEYKRKLSNRFDCFLADSRVCHRVYSILGLRSFHFRRKTPTPVKITEGNTKQNIMKALKKTVAFHKGCTDRFTIQIGHTGMTEQQLQENIINVWNQYPQEMNFYWENIRRAVLFTHGGPEFPIFATLNPPVNGPRPYNMVWSKKSSAPVVGELCNERDQIATVYPSGKITLKGGKKVDDDGQPFNPTKAQKRILQKKAEEVAAASKKKSADSSDDEFGGRNDMIDSDLEDSMMPEMELDSDTEEEEKEVPVAKKGKKAEKSSSGKPDNKTKAGKKNSKKAKEEKVGDEEEDSEEFDVDKAEELYLHDLAVEKKAKAKQMAVGKGKGNKKEPAPADSEEGSDSEGEMDDSAFGIASSDEGSDNDDEPAKPVIRGKKAKKMALKPQQKGGKQAQQGKNISKDTKENVINEKKVENNPKQKGKLNKPSNKPGAQKNRQQTSPNNSKQTNSSSTNSSPSTSDSGKKKNSFQGVKAEQIKAKKLQKRKMKKKQKKIAAKQGKEVA